MPLQLFPQIVNAGFDRAATPVFQMVPAGGMRTLKVMGAAGRVPRVRDPKILTASQVTSGTETRVVLFGHRAGRTLVEWVSPGAPKAAAAPSEWLDVSVKAERQVRTSFYYVNDGADQKTIRKVADLNALISAANILLQMQANVRIARKGAAPLPISAGLGPVLTVPSDITTPADPILWRSWDRLKIMRDLTADLTVFFVTELEMEGTSDFDADAVTEIGGEVCVFEDDTGIPEYRVLAHEVVHALAVVGDYSDATALMDSGAQGEFLRKSEINTINPSGL